LGAAKLFDAAHIARETLQDDLTRERDGLEALLVVRARERGLPRDWPARFFRVARRDGADAVAPPAGEPPPAAPPNPW
jgi:hypothetical protein